MTKSDMAELARLGARTRLQTIERQLLSLYREFPEEFIGGVAPVLVSPELKSEGNDWPSFTATTAPTNGNGNGNGTAKHKAAWTPERRAAQSRRMKKRARTQTIGVGVAKKSRSHHGGDRKPAPPWGTFTWQRMHDFLANQDGRRAKMADIMKGIDAKTQPTVISSVKMHGELFKRVGQGEYMLKKILGADEKTA